MKKIKKKKKLQSMKSLKQKADKVFSFWIRKRDKNKCYTCGKIFTEEQQAEGDSQNGHYEPRTHTATRYDEKNCHCQCRRCNIFLKGNYQSYAINLISEYGSNILKELRKIRNTTVKCDRTFLNNIIKKYE